MIPKRFRGGKPLSRRAAFLLLSFSIVKKMEK
jgi:hypothetical protein